MWLFELSKKIKDLCIKNKKLEIEIGILKERISNIESGITTT